MSPNRTLTPAVSTTATTTTATTTASTPTATATTAMGRDPIADPENPARGGPGMTGSPRYPSVSSCNGSSGPVGATGEREAST